LTLSPKTGIECIIVDIECLRNILDAIHTLQSLISWF